jgi:hypothetical protein
MELETELAELEHLIGCEIKEWVTTVETSPRAMNRDVLGIAPALRRTEVNTDVLHHAGMLTATFPSVSIGPRVRQHVVVLGARLSG